MATHSSDTVDLKHYRGKLNHPSLTQSSVYQDLFNIHPKSKNSLARSKQSIFAKPAGKNLALCFFFLMTYNWFHEKKVINFSVDFWLSRVLLIIDTVTVYFLNSSFNETTGLHSLMQWKRWAMPALTSPLLSTCTAGFCLCFKKSKRCHQHCSHHLLPT